MTTTRTALAIALTAAALIVGAPAAQAEECFLPADPSVAIDCYEITDRGAPAEEAAPGEEQLPEERDGRAITCPDGSDGRQEGDMVICPAPAAVTSLAPTQDRIGDAGGDAAVTVDTPPAATSAAPAPLTPGAPSVPGDPGSPVVTGGSLVEWILALLRDLMPWPFGAVS
jgi:hypothetical protein